MGLTLESQNSVFPCASLAQPESPWTSLRALQESLYQGPIMVAPAEPSAGLEPDRANWSQEGGTTAYPQAKSIWKDVLNLAIMEPVGSVWDGPRIGVLEAVFPALSLYAPIQLWATILPPEPGMSDCEQHFGCWHFKRIPGFLPES